MIHKIEDFTIVDTNDVIILQYKGIQSEIEMLEIAQKIFKEAFPNQTVIVLPNEFDIQILRKKDY